MSTRIRICARIMIMVGIGVITVLAGTGVTTGNGQRFWDNHAVIIGVIKEKKITKTAIELNIDVKAVVATDILITDNIIVKYKRGPGSPYLRYDPSNNDMSLLCIQRINPMVA